MMSRRILPSFDLDSMTPGYPLQFRPIFRDYLWGGRRLGSVLGKEIPPGPHIAESWEVVDHGADQSLVLAGRWQGRSLSELVREDGPALLGRGGWQQFPLLLKFLDAQRTLSVQVHPNDAQGAQLQPPDLGKTEAWYVLEAQPESVIYAGLRSGVTRKDLAAAVEAGQCETCLHQFPVTAGDCIFIPAGTVHAIGAGLLIAEIQQASDTTFRLFDWNRVDANGQPRQLHLQQALEVIDFQRGPVDPVTPRKIEPGEGGAAVAELVTCEKFVMHRVTVKGTCKLGGNGQLHLLAVVEGSAACEHEALPQQLPAGQVVMLPASAEAIDLTGPATVLDITLPAEFAPPSF